MLIIIIIIIIIIISSHVDVPQSQSLLTSTVLHSMPRLSLMSDCVELGLVDTLPRWASLLSSFLNPIHFFGFIPFHSMSFYFIPFRIFQGLTPAKVYACMFVLWVFQSWQLKSSLICTASLSHGTWKTTVSNTRYVKVLLWMSSAGERHRDGIWGNLDLDAVTLW